MNRLRNSIITAVGFLVLIALGTVINSREGYAAPSAQTQNVNVVNTPAVNAQQTGAWTVGITGTPAVGLDAGNNTVKFDADNNTVRVDPATTLSVRDVDNPARRPFAGSCVINNNQGFPCTVATVPPGKRLVIEMVQLANPNGGPELTVVTNGNQIVYTFFQSTELVRAYADPGSSVSIAGGQAGMKAAISGYLVDLP
ncbi:MAG TPA: hypothetical protein VKD91_23300 [Pyrinomonadaceae bacterium]|nr:hypothetical protein [Pyrinomonadaceae bacterium]